jgi:hypothetical protein
MTDSPHVPAPDAPSPVAPSRASAEQTLHVAASRLGVAFSDALRILRYDPEAETAFWRIDRSSGEEQIHVGPLVLSLGVDATEMVLRHEILHRSMYHAFLERFTNATLANLTLDVCINRLLYAAWPEPMRVMSAGVYPAESKTTPIALADCTAEPSVLPESLRRLWVQVWQRTGGTGPSLNPASLYYQLLRLDAVALLPSWYRDRGYAPTAMPSRAMQRAVDAMLEAIGRALPHGSPTAAALDEYTVSPVRIGTDALEAFVRSMRVRTQVDQMARALTAALERATRVDPYPLLPSRLGLVYRAIGLSAATGRYWNTEASAAGARLALGVYVDVSGSMVSQYPIVVSVVEAIKAYPLRLHAFDDTVRALDLDAFAAGRITGGGGTDFDAAVRHLLADRDVAAGLLVTDGEGMLSRATVHALRASSKRLYVIYLRSAARSAPRAPDALARCAESVFEISPSAAGAS